MLTSICVESKPLELRETGDGVQVAGLSLHKPSSAEEVLLLLEQGNSRRCQSATGANAQSSRSHGVLQIVVEQRDRAGGTSSTVKVGKLALIDLAGSERASRTKNQGKQLVEGANINKSLLVSCYSFSAYRLFT
jgi:kinesin family protein 18/19